MELKDFCYGLALLVRRLGHPLRHLPAEQKRANRCAKPRYHLLVGLPFHLVFSWGLLELIIEVEGSNGSLMCHF